MPNKINKAKEDERMRKRQARRNGTPHSQGMPQQLPLPASLPQRPSWIPLGGQTNNQQQMSASPSMQPPPTPAGLQQQQQFVFDEDQEQPSQRTASPSGGLADHEVRPAEGNNSASANIPAVRYTGGNNLVANTRVAPQVPSTVLDASSTDALATPAVSTSGGHKSPAALTAGYDFDKEVDQFLIEEGWRPVAEMHNSMVEQKYGRCSFENHQLLAWQDPTVRAAATEDVAKWQCIPSKGDYGCKPKWAYAIITYKWWCPHCKEGHYLSTSPERIVAIMQEPVEMLWKAVIKCRKYSKYAYVFQASAYCCIFQNQNHCLLKRHIRLETIRQNIIRKSHHSGRTGCWCPDPCLDDRVKHKQLTQWEEGNGQYKGRAQY